MEERCAVGLLVGELGADGFPHWHTSGCLPESDPPGVYVGSFAGSDQWSDARNERRAD